MTTSNPIILSPEQYKEIITDLKLELKVAHTDIDQLQEAFGEQAKELEEAIIITNNQAKVIKQVAELPDKWRKQNKGNTGLSESVHAGELETTLENSSG